MSVLLEVIGRIVDVGATLGAGKLQEKAQKETDKKNLQLYREEQKKEEDRYQDVIQETRRATRIGRQDAQFSKDMAIQDRQTAKEDKAYNRMQTAANKWAQYLNMENSLKSAKLSPLMNRG